MAGYTKFVVIFIGEMAVGKTSILKRYKMRNFCETTCSTVVADCDDIFLKVKGETIRLIIWDTAGQEKFRSIVISYYRKAEGVLLVFDVTDPLSFSRVKYWLSELRKINDHAEVIIVGNKAEDPNRRMVSDSDIRNFVRQEGLDYMECSAKSGYN
ncbi:Ras-related protein RABA2a, partial [Stegodyphus mimosarum]